MYKYFFTVFTATYNRAYRLSDLYRSLISQKYRNFEWLIIDDGSTDNTAALVESFIDEGILSISYFKKENEGKHVAINIGADKALGKWFFIVDSDDYILPSALMLIKNYCEMVDKKKEYAGVAGLRANKKGEIWSTGSLSEINSNQAGKFNRAFKEYLDASPVDYRYKLKVKGDRAEIIKTDILRRYKFPSFPGEKFMPERFLWYSLSQDGYQFRWVNRVIYITEYLEDGLIKNGEKLARESCKCRSFVDNLSMGVKGIPVRAKLLFCINYLRYGRLSGKNWGELCGDCSTKGYLLFALPISFFLRLR